VDVEPSDDDLERSRAWLTRELHITQPGIVVSMGEPALDFVNSLEFPLSGPVANTVGSLQRFTPTIDLLAVPDIDESLNESAAKRDFWAAFKALGEWYENLPPY